MHKVNDQIFPRDLILGVNRQKAPGTAAAVLTPAQKQVKMQAWETLSQSFTTKQY